MNSVWAKRDGVNQPLPLLAHSIDTAVVAFTAWESFSAGVRSNATALLAPGNEALARARFAFLAGVHDCGKASPEFQGQAWSSQADEFADVRAQLRADGLPMDVPAQRPALIGSHNLWLRHEAITGFALLAHTQLPAWVRRIVTPHHGRYQPTFGESSPPQALQDVKNRAMAPGWSAVHAQVITDLVTAVHALSAITLDFDSWPDTPPKRLRAFLVPMAGFVSICDWIASDEAFLAIAPRDLLNEVPTYTVARQPMAVAALEGVLSGSSTPVGTFATLFFGRTPRGVQQWADSCEHGPGLAIICAPMGEGKTEAALTRHVRDAQTESGQPASDQLFFGLPTVSTADAMFDRVNDLWSDTPATGHLAHSHAISHAFYAPTSTRPLNICDPSDGVHAHSSDGSRLGGLDSNSFFQGKHRALLAPVSVGTQDQPLAGGLAHKYVTVRHAGLAGKHLILDEVHTYDPYQHTLLCRLLEWLGAYRTRVTLLSATLPHQRVQDLVWAYSRGWDGEPAQDVLQARINMIPDPLPYPAVTVVDDAVTVLPQTSWRHFTLGITAHTIAAVKKDNVAATASVLTTLRAQNPHARIGLIVNTVDRAIAVYDLVKDDPTHGRSVLLHSRMTSGQRRERTAQLHALVGPGAPAGANLVVATQIAEASLDLDFDILVSDLAPMASLWQRSGRMWRHSLNNGHGWSHPPHLAYRTGDPVLHVLVPVNDDGQFAGQSVSLPYTAAELRKTWQHPACLDRGARPSFQVPRDMQPSVDAAVVSWTDLVDGDSETGPAKEVIRALGEALTKTTSQPGTVLDITRGFARWHHSPTPDPWGTHDPDWSALTAPVLWDDAAVTRLQGTDQATIVVCDPSGQTPWAWQGDPEALANPRLTLPAVLRALEAVVPVSGALARAAIQVGLTSRPDDWFIRAPRLLRDIIPILVSDLAGFATLDPDLGLISLKEAN